MGNILDDDRWTVDTGVTDTQNVSQGNKFSTEESIGTCMSHENKFNKNESHVEHSQGAQKEVDSSRNTKENNEIANHVTEDTIMAKQDGKEKPEQKRTNNLSLFRLINDIELDENSEKCDNSEHEIHKENFKDSTQNKFVQKRNVDHNKDLQHKDSKQTRSKAFQPEKGDELGETKDDIIENIAGRHGNFPESDNGGPGYAMKADKLQQRDNDANNAINTFPTVSKVEPKEGTNHSRKYVCNNEIKDFGDTCNHRVSTGEPKILNEPEYLCQLCSVTPHDHPFRPISDKHHSESDSDFVVDPGPTLYCELCLEETRVVPVSSYCVDCELYLCASCRRYHHKIQATRNHLVMNQQELITKVYDKYMPSGATETSQEKRSKAPDYPPLNRKLVNSGKYANDHISKGNNFCGPCLYEMCKVEATSFCYDCGEYMCRLCRVQHSRMSPTSGHDLVNREYRDQDFDNFVPTLDPDTNYEELLHGTEAQRDGLEYKPTERKLTRIKGIGAKTDQDVNSVFITGSSFFGDGKIILTDYNNRRVKLYDSIYKLVSHLELMETIADVVVVNFDEVAMTMPNRKQLIFIRIDSRNELHKHRTVATIGKYWGIDFKHEELFALCVGLDKMSTSVHIMNIMGQLLTVVIPSDDSIPGPVLKSAQYLTVSPTGGTIYISDVDQGVVAFGMDGRIIFSIADKEMVGVKGLAVDSRNIYICSRNHLHQMGHDGTCVKRLLSTYDNTIINSPYTVSVDPAGKQLLVSMEDSDVVQMYSFG